MVVYLLLGLIFYMGHFPFEERWLYLLFVDMFLRRLSLQKIFLILLRLFVQVRNLVKVFQVYQLGPYLIKC